MKEAISNKLKYYNWIFTLIIAAYHALSIDSFNIIYSNSWEEKLLEGYIVFINNMATVAMIFFFFISGFWFYYNLLSLQEIKRKCLKRIKTLFVPYVLWTVAAMLFHWLLGTNVDLSIKNWINLFFWDPVNSPLWYLLALLLLQVISPIVICVKNKKISITFLGSCVCYLVLRNAGIIHPILYFENWWWYQNMMNYLPAYLLGACVGLHFPDVILKREYGDKKSLICGFSMMFVSAFTLHFVEGSQFSIVLCSVGLVGSWLILKTDFFNREVPKIFSGSFYIYVMHQPILIMSTSIVIKKIVGDCCVNGIAVLIIKLLQVGIIVMCSYITRTVFKTILPPKLFGYLSGGRGV